MACNQEQGNATPEASLRNDIKVGVIKNNRNERRSYDDNSEPDERISSGRDVKTNRDGRRTRHRSENRHSKKSMRNSRSNSRGRDRCSRQEKRRKEKRRYGERSSSSSTSRSHSRSYSRSKSSKAKTRQRYGGRQRRRVGSSEASSNYDCSDADTDQRRNCKTQCDSYRFQEPNNTVMVRGLASHLNENDLRDDVFRCGITVKDIRLIRNHDTGTSRGFAFVEFNTVGDAIRWMDIKKGILVLNEQFHASLIYSIPKMSTFDGLYKPVVDWLCQTCNGHNFKRREFCYKCNAPRPEQEDLEMSDEISSLPTSTIVLGNLDTLTTEEGVLQAFQSKPSMSCIPIKAVKIARELDTCLSRGICYVEANNISEAIRLFSVLKSEVLEIDGRAVSVAYGKVFNPITVLKNKNAAAAALAAAQWTNNSTTATTVTGSSPPCTEVKTEVDVEKMARYCAGLFAKTIDEYCSYLEYYRKYYNQKMTKEFTSATETTGSQESFVWQGEQYTTAQLGFPDMRSYQYDETSGYYFDPMSGMYYDATTQYFYDAKKQQFLYWCTNKNKYVEAPGSCYDKSSVDEEIHIQDMNKQKTEKVEKLDEVKGAKLIAKKMEKWAKTLNQKKLGSSTPKAVSAVTASSAIAIPSFPYPVAAQNGESSISHKHREYNVAPVPENVTTANVCQIAASNCRLIMKSQSEYDGVNDGYNTELKGTPKELGFVDESKLACLLCKRKFSSKEVLEKHLMMSDLHKRNLEILQQVPEDSIRSPSSTSEMLYRDRAKERRDRCGFDSNVTKNTLKDLYLQAKELSSTYVEEPNTGGIKDDNIGNRMLQKMGWHEGQGLGGNNQGRVDIIMAERRTGKFGLGIRAPEAFDEKLDPQSLARKVTLARYQELD